MKLLDDFFYITDSSIVDSENIKCAVSFNEAHTIYKAHFIGNPITPGVCLVQMAIEIMENIFKKSFVLQRVKSIKFKKPITPKGKPSYIFTKIVDEGDSISASVSIEDSSDQFVKLVGMQLKVIS